MQALEKMQGGMTYNPSEGLDDIRLVLKIKPLAAAIIKKEKPSHPQAVFIMGRLEKRTVCSLSPRVGP